MPCTTLHVPPPHTHTIHPPPSTPQATHRIFRILDRDRDGFLSPDEFGQYQSSAFEMRLTEEEITTFFQVRRSFCYCTAASDASAAPLRREGTVMTSPPFPPPDPRRRVARWH